MSSAAPVIAEGLYSFQIGGSERVGVDLALAFRDRGYQVICFALYGSEGPFKQTLEQQGIRCVNLDYTQRWRPSRRVTFQLEFWRFLRREKVSALHVHHAAALMLCGLAAKFAGVRRTVMTEHALFQLQERPDYRRSAVRYCKLADAITVVAPEQRDYFHNEIHVPLERLHYLPNGVAVRPRIPAVRARIRQEFSIDDDRFVFMYVGRLNEIKSLPTLLNAIALCADLRAHWLIVGDGPERAALEALRVTLGIESRVTFAGARTDVHDLLMAADGFVMSSRSEGMPMAMLEAMAAELPCVSTAVGGIPGLLVDGAGLLVPPAAPDQMAMAMRRVVEDSQLRASIIARASQRIATDYSLDAVVTRYLALLGLPAKWGA